MSGTEQNVVSVSGGKDSTALLLLAIGMEVPNLQAVFADTGHEHQQTYDYVRYLADATGVPIRWVKADFSQQIARKRIYVAENWAADGVPADRIERAKEFLQPTGIPFLDLCLWKGRFPSTRARFCSEELKRNPLIEQVMLPLLDGNNMVLSWQGVRADESENRRWLPECDEVGGGAVQLPPHSALDCQRCVRGTQAFRHQSEPSLQAGNGPRRLHAMHPREEG